MGRKKKDLQDKLDGLFEDDILESEAGAEAETPEEEIQAPIESILTDLLRSETAAWTAKAESVISQPDLASLLEPAVPEPVEAEPATAEPAEPEPVAEPIAVEPAAPETEPIEAEPVPAEPVEPEPIAEFVAVEPAEPESVVEPVAARPAGPERIVSEPAAVEPAAPETEPIEAEPVPAGPVGPEPIAELVAVEPAEPESVVGPVAARPVEPEWIVSEPAAVELAEPEPVVEPVTAGPAEPEWIVAEPAAIEPAEPEPIAEHVAIEPAEPESVVEPVTIEPPAPEPAEVKMIEVEPALAEPAVAEPVVTAPTTAEPAVAEPAPEAAPPGALPWEATLQQQRLRILNRMLWILSALAAVSIAATIVQARDDPDLLRSNIPYVVAWLALLVLALPPRLTRLSFTVRVGTLIGLGYAVGTYLLWRGGPQGMGDLFLMVAPLLFSILGKQWVGITSAIVSILIYAVIVSLHYLGLGSVTPPDLTQFTTLIDVGSIFALLVLAAVLVQQVFNSYLTGALQETARSQTLLGERADELATSNTLLQRRTRQLQTAAQISQATAAVLDPDDLVQQVVGLIQHQLVLYHVSLFLVDEAGGDDGGRRAVLKASTGDVGRRMLSQGYWVAVGSMSPVGWCIANGQPSVSLDVSEEAARIDELLLPRTRSNVALPLQTRGRVIGALNVQSTEREAFSQEDIAVLQTIADQLAVAIDNAQLFAETQERVERLEAIQRTYVRDEWAKFTRTQATPLYERTRPNVPRLSDPGLPGDFRELQQTIQQAALQQKVVAGGNGAEGKAALVAPLSLRGEVIGALGLHEADQEREWTDDEIALVEAVATQMALAIENARLLEETQQRAGRLALINRITGTASAATNLEALMEAVCNDVIPAFDADVFFIAFHDEEAGEMDYRYVMDEGVRIPPIRRSMGVGVAFDVVTGRKPVLINTGDEYRRLQPTAPTLGETRFSESWLGVPMMIGERVLGVINVQSYRPNVWDEEDVLLLSTIADQVTVAIENVRLLEETQQRAERLTVVNRITSAASAAISTDDLLETVYREIIPVFQPIGAFIALYDDEANELDFRITLDEKGRGGPERHPLSGFSSVVVAEKRLLSIRDYEREKDRLPQPTMLGEGRRLYSSWMGVPMLVGERVIGVISVMANVPNAYSEEDEQLLSTIADQVAVAIQNVRLFEETQRRAERLAVVNRIAGTAGAALNTDDLMEAVYNEVAPVFRPDAFFIAVYDDITDELEFRFNVDEGVRQPVERHPLGEGLSSIAIAERQPLFIRDLSQRPEYQVQPMGTGKLPLCWLGVPLLAGDRVVGVMNVQSYTPNVWDEEDGLLFSTIADQAAVALENVRLFEEARIRADELAVLNELAQALTARLGVDEVLEEAYRGASRLVDATNFHIGLYDPKKHVIAFPTSEDDTGEFLLPAEKGVSGYILRTRQPVLIADKYAEWTAARGIDSVGHEALSWVGAPLLVGNQPLGVMFTQNFEATHAFDEHDRDLLASIANQVAIALQNARLFEDARIRTEELAALNELAQDLTAATTLDQVLREAYEGASRMLRTKNFYVGLYDPDRFEITFPFDSSESEEDRQITAIPADQGLTGYIVQNRESVVIGEDMDEQLKRLGIESIGGDSLSWLGVPMMIGDQVMGVMVVQSYTTAKAYDDRDRDLLMSIASQTAIAIQSARLFEQAQERAQRERQIYEITAKLRRSPDITTILQTAVDELGRALRVDRALVRLKTTPRGAND